MLSDAELDMIADAGGRASVAPEVEANMGHGPAATARLRSRGIPTGLSADVCTNVGGDLFGAMRVAIALQRGADHAAALARGETLGEVSLTAREVLAMATVDGARACGLDDRIGTLEVGKQADVLLLRADTPNLAPLSDPSARSSTPREPTTWTRCTWPGGRSSGRAAFVDIDVRSVIARATASHDYLLGPPAWPTRTGARPRCGPESLHRLGGGGDDLVENRLVGQRRRVQRGELADQVEHPLDEWALDDRCVTAGDGGDVEILDGVDGNGRTCRGRPPPATG